MVKYRAYNRLVENGVVDRKPYTFTVDAPTLGDARRIVENYHRRWNAGARLRGEPYKAYAFKIVKVMKRRKHKR